MSGLHELHPEQRRAADPEVNAWVSASAGTGKTQVLSARVLRLLVGGASPGGILALTFTKAAAAEMQTRIFETLARWVRAEDAEIAADLSAIGCAASAAAIARARTLFAHALDAKGGLKVQTLHSFASTILSAFPLEANVAPGYDTLDDRSGVQLRAEVLVEAVARAEHQGDRGFLEDLAELSVRRGEAKVAALTAELLKSREAIGRLSGGIAIEPVVRRHLGLPADGDRLTLLARRLEAGFDWEAVDAYAAALARWGAKTGLAHADTLTMFRTLPVAEQAARLYELCGVGFVKDGDGDARKPGCKDPDFAAAHQRFCEAVGALRDFARALELSEIAALHLRVGHRLAAGYAEKKRHAGALDFDDLIARAADLLRSLAAPWVLYKLDQRIDHILVDEGQDTNAAQWTIVHAIAEEFFAGEGARESARSQFAVGDYKQAIFSFQGTDPREFERARQTVRGRAEGAGAAFADIDLTLSFRSVPAVLALVDQVVAELGHEAFGLSEPVPRHRAFREGAGSVTLWPALAADAGADEEEAGWQGEADQRLADKIAAQIAAWIRARMVLPAKGRPVRPEDILILVRKRGDLVPALVAALHKAGVPVAGADRLRLTAPIAVQDLLALVRFALQPDDDLTLASLLVSPLIGWSQAALFELAHGRSGSLWAALRARQDAMGRKAADWLRAVLAMADYSAPYDFLETVLSGPLQGRARLLARLGEEARDPIEEVLTQALLYEKAQTPSLQGFLAWIEAEDVDVKRDPDAPQAAVRIMTAHGAKGLQAPIVILADAAKAVPSSSRRDSVPFALGEAGEVPLYFGSKSLLGGEVLKRFDAEERAAAEEHLRLLYVALTRAEDMLFVGGALPKRAPAAPSWHDIVRKALGSLGANTVDDSLWGEGALRFSSGEAVVPARAPAAEVAAMAALELPGWALRPAPEEARPPRPLAPSEIEDEAGLPPPGPALQAAALRGQLLHGLFQRLPQVPPAGRRAAARAWLERRAEGLDTAAMAGEVLGVMDDPAFAALFGPEALSEAPVSAIVEDRVISGTLDKLLVELDRVRIVDFKTGRAVPGSAAEIPGRHRAQMEAYRAALMRIFPGREVEAALLYTAGPKLFVI